MKTRKHQCRIQLAASKPVAYRLVWQIIDILRCAGSAILNSISGISIIECGVYWMFWLCIHWNRWNSTWNDLTLVGPPFMKDSRTNTSNRQTGRVWLFRLRLSSFCYRPAERGWGQRE